MRKLTPYECTHFPNMPCLNTLTLKVNSPMLGTTGLNSNMLLSTKNKTGLQPVSRPVEQIVGFFHKYLKKVQKNGAKIYSLKF